MSQNISLTEDTVKKKTQRFRFNANHARFHGKCSCKQGLVPAMFLDGEGREVANGDPRCGLYIRSRHQVSQGCGYLGDPPGAVEAVAVSLALGLQL